MPTRRRNLPKKIGARPRTGVVRPYNPLWDTGKIIDVLPHAERRRSHEEGLSPKLKNWPKVLGVPLPDLRKKEWSGLVEDIGKLFTERPKGEWRTMPWSKDMHDPMGEMVGKIKKQLRLREGDRINFLQRKSGKYFLREYYAFIYPTLQGVVWKWEGKSMRGVWVKITNPEIIETLNKCGPLLIWGERYEIKETPRSHHESGEKNHRKLLEE